MVIALFFFFLAFISFPSSDPMRITKKYAGKSCIGKQIYQPCEGYQNHLDAIKDAERELEMYEKIFLNKIQSKMQQSHGRLRVFTDRERPRNDSKATTSGNSEVDEGTSGEDGPNDDAEEGHLYPRLASHSPRHPLLRRNLSAPDLYHSTHDSFPPRSPRLSPNGGIKGELFIKGEHGSFSRDDAFLLFPPDDYYRSYQSSPFSNKKRCRSVMALMDFEKLVTDDQAAG
jgi:hypothetical protein